ncbi:hypothetical protein D3C85_1344460 [compost metagenome]
MQLVRGRNNRLAQHFCDFVVGLQLCIHNGAVIHRLLNTLSDGRHHRYGLDRILSSSRLTGKHDNVRTIKHGVGYVTHLGARRTRVALHGIQHLGSGDNRFTS